MKRTRQVKRGTIKKSRKKKKRHSHSTFLLTMIVLFVITSALSYVYFKPILAFKSSRTLEKGIEKEAVKADKADKDALSHRLYRSQIWYDIGLKRANMIVTIEDLIREYIRPHGVRLLDLYMDRDGVVYIDLSDEMIKNFKGDALNEYSLIMGLYRRIKKGVRNISAMKLLIEGKEVQSIGGHIDISRPIGGEFAVR